MAKVFLTAVVIVYTGGIKTPIVSSSDLLPSLGENDASEDIHNPLEEALAQLSTSPSGKRRTPLLPTYRRKHTQSLTCNQDIWGLPLP